MGRAGPRRPAALRIPDPRRSAGGLELGDNPEKAAELSDAFDNFDAAIIARYGSKKRQRLLADAGIVRNRLKIDAAIENAKAFLAVQSEMGTFAEYIWGFVAH
jgi:3-methyladenine DNA glycosylase Tag